MNGIDALSNEQLMQMYQQTRPAAPAPTNAPAAPASNLSGLSDADLMAQYKAVQPEAPAKRPFGILDTWPVRLAKGIYSAVTLPGEVAQAGYEGRPTGIPQSANMPGGESTENIGRVTDLAALINPITPRAVPTLRPNVAPTSEALAQAEKQGFEQAYGKGVEVPPSSVATVAQDIGQKLFAGGRNAATDAPRTYGVLEQMARAPQGSTATVANLHSMRKAFGNIAADKAATDSERAAAGIAKQHFDTYLGNLSKTPGVVGDAQQATNLLADAIRNSAAGFRSETVSGIGDVARGSAEATNTYGQIGRNIRTGINAALKRGDISTGAGFSPAEVAAAEAVRRSGRLPGVIGSALGGSGGPWGLLTGILSAGAAPVAGAGLKQLETLAAKRALNQLDQMVRMRSPLGQAGMVNMPYAPNPLIADPLRRLYPQLPFFAQPPQ